MDENVEFHNETEEEYNVVVCRGRATKKIYVHLLGDQDEIHEDEATTVPAKGYENAPIHDEKL